MLCSLKELQLQRPVEGRESFAKVDHPLPDFVEGEPLEPCFTYI